jgi:hypothetical protein
MLSQPKKESAPEVAAAPVDEQLPDWMMDLRERLRPYLRYGSFEVRYDVNSGKATLIRFHLDFTQEGYRSLMRSMRS